MVSGTPPPNKKRTCWTNTLWAAVAQELEWVIYSLMSVVRFPTPLPCVPETPNCPRTVWEWCAIEKVLHCMNVCEWVNGSCTVKHFEWSSRLKINHLPFANYLLYIRFHVNCIFKPFKVSSGFNSYLKLKRAQLNTVFVRSPFIFSGWMSHSFLHSCLLLWLR